MRHLAVFLPVLSLGACSPSPSPDRLAGSLKQHPEILVEAIKAHPVEILEALQVAADSYQKVAQARSDSAEEERISRELAQPRKPNLGGDRAIRGNPDAAVTIVVYSDFQCPYCRQDVPVLRALLQKYPDQVRILLKQTPLPRHPYARRSAELFEALKRQSGIIAWRFYDRLFTDQERLDREGYAFLEVAAREAGGDLALAKRDADGPAIRQLIEGDLAEFQGYGFTGTPGFLINGVMLDGARPIASFERIIHRFIPASDST